MTSTLNQKIVYDLNKLETLKYFNILTSIPWKKYKKVLIIGMGGGCDVFSAFSFHKYLYNSLNKLINNGNMELHFGNTTGLRKALDNHTKITDAFYKVKSFTKLEKNKNYYGQCVLEESLYDEKYLFGPYLTIVHLKKTNDEYNTVEKVTKYNSDKIIKSWKKMKYDLIIGIDNGGDSITGGIDFKESFLLGRDMQILQIMKQYEQLNYGHCYHLVFGPCSDGETEYKKMKTYLTNSIENNYFVGAFNIDEYMINLMKEKSGILASSRTTNIISNTYNKYRDEIKSDPDKMITIERNLNPTIPIKWLIQCWVFKYT